MGDACNSCFEGIIFTGAGEGSFYVNLYSKRFLEKIGYIPYPGTLNLKLLEGVDVFNKCLEKVKPIVIEPPTIPGARLGAVHVYPANIRGLFNESVHIVRPLISVYKNDVVELIARVHLRSTLGLVDNSKIGFRLITPSHEIG